MLQASISTDVTPYHPIICKTQQVIYRCTMNGGVKTVNVEHPKDVCPPNVYLAKKDQRISFDAKVVNCVVSSCVLLGLALVIAGAVVSSQIKQEADSCPCPEDGTRCCYHSPSVCSQCYCEEEELESGDESVYNPDAGDFCADYENTTESGAAAIAIAIAGVVVCVVSAAMLITMRWCKNWSEKHLHVRYPAVTPYGTHDEAI